MIAKPLLAAALLVPLVSAGCSPPATGSGDALRAGGVLSPTRQTHGLPARARRGTGPGGYISHVIVVIQENRTFENFFAGYPGANAPAYGCVSGNAPGVRSLPSARRATASQCPDPSDFTVPLTETTFEKNLVLKHDWRTSITEWNKGNMDGFWRFGQKKGAYEAYQYIEHKQIQPYWDMAQQYVLSDAMFPTEFGGSFTAHLTLIAGTDDLRPDRAVVNFTSGPYDDCDSPPGTRTSYLTTTRAVHHFKGPFPCFTQWNTIANNLDAAGVPWKYYATKKLDAGLWEPYEAMSYTRYGSDWKTSSRRRRAS